MRIRCDEEPAMRISCDEEPWTSCECDNASCEAVDTKQSGEVTPRFLSYWIASNALFVIRC
jgi:hypothetical protein